MAAEPRIKDSSLSNSPSIIGENDGHAAKLFSEPSFVSDPNPFALHWKELSEGPG